MTEKEDEGKEEEHEDEEQELVSSKSNQSSDPDDEDDDDDDYNGQDLELEDEEEDEENGPENVGSGAKDLSIALKNLTAAHLRSVRDTRIAFCHFSKDFELVRTRQPQQQQQRQQQQPFGLWALDKVPEPILHASLESEFGRPVELPTKHNISLPKLARECGLQHELELCLLFGNLLHRSKRACQKLRLLIGLGHNTRKSRVGEKKGQGLHYSKGKGKGSDDNDNEHSPTSATPRARLFNIYPMILANR